MEDFVFRRITEYATYCTFKEPPALKSINTKHRSKFAALPLVLVTAAG
jgi:hypothetical protein